MIVGSTGLSPNQVLIKPRKYLTIQGHPEYPSGFVQDLIDLRMTTGIFSQEFVARLPDVHQPIDNKLYAEVILQFLAQ